MITIESYYNENLKAQNFIIRVPDKDVISMDFNEEELSLLKKAQTEESNPYLTMEVLSMIVRKAGEVKNA